MHKYITLNFCILNNMLYSTLRFCHINDGYAAGNVPQDSRVLFIYYAQKVS